MWRAVRAGLIVRAQRAIQDGDRPFKRDVRSRKFQNECAEREERPPHGLDLSAYPLCFAPACAANSFDLRAHAVRRLRYA